MNLLLRAAVQGRLEGSLRMLWLRARYASLSYMVAGAVVSVAGVTVLFTATPAGQVLQQAAGGAFATLTGTGAGIKEPSEPAIVATPAAPTEAAVTAVATPAPPTPAPPTPARTPVPPTALPTEAPAVSASPLATYAAAPVVSARAAGVPAATAPRRAPPAPSSPQHSEQPPAPTTILGTVSDALNGATPPNTSRTTSPTARPTSVIASALTHVASESKSGQSALPVSSGSVSPPGSPKTSSSGPVSDVAAIPLLRLKKAL